MFGPAALVALAALSTASILPRESSVWQPAVGEKWQIVITNNISVDPFNGAIPPTDATIIDIDLFNTPKEVFTELHNQGKKVICYFSAGSAEDWRPDYAQFTSDVVGKTLGCWPGEKYLKITSKKVFDLMAARIKLASEKGCDAIDPDNMDVYSNDSGFKLSASDAAKYLNKMAAEAAKYGMATGLKNAMELLPSVQDNIQFAVNEECVAGGDCGKYSNFIKSKPVFHIEYVKRDGAGGKPTIQSALDSLTAADSAPSTQAACGDSNAKQFSTVIKELLLTGWVRYCDDSTAETPVFNVGTGGPNSGYCGKGLRRRLKQAKAQGITQSS